MTSLAEGQPSHGSRHANEPREMKPGQRVDGAVGPAICPTDTDTIAPTRRAEERTIPKQSWQYVARSGIAGGIASCAAKTVVAPLDRVKILFQASNPQFAKYTGSWSGAMQAMNHVYSGEGVRGLFRGHSATLLRIFPYGGIKFLAYEQVRAVVIPTRSKETPVRRFLAGSAAGCLSVFATYPLEVIRVRLAFETKTRRRISFREICTTIYNERPPAATLPASALEPHMPRSAAAALAASSSAVSAATPRSGYANFFRGFTPTLLGMIPYAGASFLTHDLAGDVMRLPVLAPYAILALSERSAKQLAPNKPPPLRAWAELTTGALAGLVSQTISYPLEVIRRRMQVGGVVGDGHRLTIPEVASTIYKDKGFRGFYVGLSIGYVKVVPMVATSFFVYERTKIWFGI